MMKLQHYVDVTTYSLLPLKDLRTYCGKRAEHTSFVLREADITCTACKEALADYKRGYEHTSQTRSLG
jgi:hypothetical protein